MTLPDHAHTLQYLAHVARHVIQLNARAEALDHYMQALAAQMSRAIARIEAVQAQQSTAAPAHG
ncbi:MAG: hypothetical protein AB7R40_25250 [Nitrospiraceae bacterium]